MSGIAIFAPFYLDSAFDAAGNYKLSQPVPRFIAPGIEFYEGVLLAMDSLNKENISLRVKVFDSKKVNGSVYKLADSGALDSIDLILGAVSGSEYLDLASIAKEKKIPFISASYPNDGGITNNPYVVVVNSKLNTHLQAIYNYVPIILELIIYCSFGGPPVMMTGLPEFLRHSIVLHPAQY